MRKANQRIAPGVIALPVSSAKSIGVLALAMTAVAVHGAKAPPPPPKPLAGYPFTFETLLEDAKRRASVPYTPQRSSLPAGLDKLSPEQYRSLHFNPDAGIWRAEKLPFRLELLRAGYNLPTAVTVSTVEDGTAKDLVATPAMFQMAPTLPAQLGKVSLPLSGFRVRSRINSNKIWDEFLVFQGASYFRAVPKNLLYGLSARGLAIDTGEPSGEPSRIFGSRSRMPAPPPS
jgi:glucans biosynthesis protein